MIIGGITFVYKLLINRQPTFERTRHNEEKEKRPVCIVLSSNCLIYRLGFYFAYNVTLTFCSTCFNYGTPNRKRKLGVSLSVCIHHVQRKEYIDFFLKMCILITHNMKTCTWICIFPHWIGYYHLMSLRS